MLHEAIPGVYTWSDFSDEKQMDFNGYYLPLAAGPLLIDPPPPSEDALQEIERLGAPTLILLTNKDHRRAAPGLARRFGARIAIHELDAPLVDCDVDETFSDGDVLEGTLTALLLPHQKSPGECALHWPARKVLFLGDALLGHPPGELSMLPDAKYADPAQARAALARLGDLDVDALFVGDGVSFPTGGGDAVRAFLAHA